MNPKKSDTAPPVQARPPPTTENRARNTHFPGVPQRDVDLVRNLAADLNALARALGNGDRASIAEVQPRIRRLTPLMLERVRLTARRAIAAAPEG